MSKVVDEVLQSGKYHVYPEYKDSGVDWLGNIPFHWEKSRIGFEASIKARLGWKGLKADEYVEDGYIFLATPNIKGSEIDFNNVNYITKFRYDESPEIKINVGDVLVTKDGSTTGTCNIVRKLPSPATVNSSIAVIRPIRNLVSEYLYYFFLSPYTQSVIKLMQGGMGVPHLFQADLCEFNILLPPMNEQRTIAAFLDYETARIDQLIAKQQWLIELLKEKRQTVISHAVTKGLNPNAPMKDSGIEWLGQVPEHWIVCKIKNLAAVISKGTTPSTIGAEFIDEGVRFLKAENIGKSNFVSIEPEFFISEDVNRQISRSQLKENDVLVIIAGATTGFASVLQKELLPANTNQAVSFIRLLEPLHSKWVLYWLSTTPVQKTIWMGAVQAAQPNLSMENLGNIPIVIPPINEIAAHLKHIENKIVNFYNLAEKAGVAIQLMQERRTALISAAVTGKIDLRGWTPPAEEVAA